MAIEMSTSIAPNDHFGKRNILKDLKHVKIEKYKNTSKSTPLKCAHA